MSGIERFLDQLRIGAPVLIQDMRILISHHGGLCVAGIALYCLDIAAGQLQLVSNTGVAQAVKYYRRQIVFLNQFLHGFTDDRTFRGHSKIRCDNQVEIHVIAAHCFLGCFLLHLPRHQHFSHRFREKHFANAAFGLRLFQNQRRIVMKALFREVKEDILGIQRVHGVFLHPLELFGDKYISRSSSDTFFRNVNAVPGQTQQFSDPQGAGESKIQAQPQSRISAALDGFEERRRVPNLSSLGLMLGKRCIMSRIFFDKIPFLCLSQCTPQKIVHLPDGGRGDKGLFLGVFLVVLLFNSRCFQKNLIILLQCKGCDLIELHLSDDRLDIVVDQAQIAGICGDRPLSFSVQFDIFIKEFPECAALWNGEGSGHLAVFDLHLPFLCLLHCAAGFPFLMLLPLSINVGVHHAEPLLTRNNTCHLLIPPLQWSEDP